MMQKNIQLSKHEDAEQHDRIQSKTPKKKLPTGISSGHLPKNYKDDKKKKSKKTGGEFHRDTVQMVFDCFTRWCLIVLPECV